MTSDEQPTRKRVDRNAVLIAVVALALVVLLVTMPAPPTALNPSAKATRNTLAIALEAYKVNFGAYPSDNVPGMNGSQILHEHLCKRLSVGQVFYGPYLVPRQAQVRPGKSGVPELISLTGRRFTYKLVKNAATGQMDVQLDEEKAGK